MGFLDNLGNEFGKKTGKAMGNKLYGKHADDIRLGSRTDLNANINHDSSSVGQNIDNYEEIEKEKRKTLKLEQNSKFLESIINVEFDSQDKDSIIKTLTILSSYVDLWLKESNKNHAIARAKFDTGLAILSTVDPQNPMITYFTNKKSEWSEAEKRKKMKTIWIVGGVIGLIAFCFILSLFI